jgi:hypothetical protein
MNYELFSRLRQILFPHFALGLKALTLEIKVGEVFNPVDLVPQVGSLPQSTESQAVAVE